MKHQILLIVFLLSIICSESLAQQWGPLESNYRRNIYKDGTNDAQSSGLVQINTLSDIGKNGSVLHRDVYQWDIPDDQIPDNSNIEYVRLEIGYTKQDHQFELPVELFKITTDILPGTNLNTIFSEMDYTVPNIGYSNGVNDYIVFESNNPSNPFNQAIRSMLPQNKFILGVKWSIDHSQYTRLWFLKNYTIKLYLEFTPPTRTVTVDQKLSNGLTTGNIGLWDEEIGQFSSYAAPKNFSWQVNDEPVLKGSHEIINGEKYNNWKINSTSMENVENHKKITILSTTEKLTSQFKQSYQDIIIRNVLDITSIDGGVINFKDPWLVDYPDPVYGNTLRNLGMDALLKSRTSPFSPDFNTGYGGDVYKGIFLNQGGTAFNAPYYTVGTYEIQDIYLSQTGKTHRFYFQNWSSPNSGAQFQNAEALETAVIFTSGSAIVNANLKGHLLSDHANAFSGNGQRKIVRDQYGIYHVVYHDSDGIWYTRSSTTDFNGAWTQDLKVSNFGVNPSIAVVGQNVKVAFEGLDEDYVGVFLTEFNYTNPQISTIAVDEDCSIPLCGQLYPAISASSSEIFILYKKSNTQGLNYFRKYWNNNIQQWVSTAPAVLPNSDGYSCNPTVAGAANDVIHIAWQQGDTQIRYYYSFRQSYTRNFSYYDIISIGSGNQYNKYPSISVYENVYPLVTWTGTYSTIADKRTAKGEAAGITNIRVTSRIKASSWGTFSFMGSEVNYSSNTSVNSYAQSVICWTQNNGSASKWVKREEGAYSGIYDLNNAGMNAYPAGGQLLDFSDIKSLVFRTSTAPVYYAEKDNTDFSSDPLKKKDIVEELTYGRKGTLYKEDLEFTYNLYDILADDQVIKFVEYTDTIPVGSLDGLNSILRTENFTLSENSNLFFSNYYNVLNQNKAASILSEGDFIKFTVELVSATDGTVAGEFDPVEYSLENLFEQNTKDYQVNCAGISAGDYYLRLKINSNVNVSYSMGNEFNDMDNLAKKNYINIGLDEEEVIYTYALAQNYPNPFNPTTTIRYQIPEDGMVTLKVYDILGREVSTLVNEFMSKGRYEAVFNAGSFASGMYIYEIRSGSFRSVKKMNLVK